MITKQGVDSYNIHTQGEQNVRVTVCKCTFFKGANAPVKSTKKSMLIKKNMFKLKFWGVLIVFQNFKLNVERAKPGLAFHSFVRSFFCFYC